MAAETATVSCSIHGDPVTNAGLAEVGDLVREAPEAEYHLDSRLVQAQSAILVVDHGLVGDIAASRPAAYAAGHSLTACHCYL